MENNCSKWKHREFTIADSTKVKGWAIILMFMHHCFLSPERYKGQQIDFTPFSESFINSVALSMKICVAIFVFISAYGITLSYKKTCGGKLDNINSGIVSNTICRRGMKLWSEFFIVFVIAQMYSLIVIKDGLIALTYGNGFKSVINWMIDAIGLADVFHTPTFLPTFWFISLAWIIILIMPLFLKLYSKFGSLVLLFAGAFFRVAFTDNNGLEIASLPKYAFVIAVGIIVADKGLITRIGDANRIPSSFKFVIETILFVMLLYVRHITRATLLCPIWDGAIAFLTCIVFYEFFNRCPIVKDILYHIGKQATNMFLVHNFIRVVWYYDFTYSFRYWWLILLVLLAISYVVSIIINALKKTIRYDKIVEALISKCVDGKLKSKEIG